MSMLPRVADLLQDSDRQFTLTLSVEPQLPVFEGHFSDRPVLAGVAQIDWAIRFAQRYISSERVFSGMRDIKFLQVIRPPARLWLSLDWQDPGVLCFDYGVPATGKTCSRGRLCFA